MASVAPLPEPRRRRQWTRANQRLVGQRLGTLACANQTLTGASQAGQTLSKATPIAGAVLSAPLAHPGEIGLGTCVRLSLSGGRSVAQMTEEGVVIEVVEPGTGVTSARVAFRRTQAAGEPRYVIQCWSRRVLRDASGLVVVSA
jgi:hypothetical protein